ncbi:hypothetical protein DL98DRAFT_42862 [Cadophora sp. DSE1049]|nr:hypothetical protein DL98DRAFT_42862 [Cadophora sp. DSE1049]
MPRSVQLPPLSSIFAVKAKPDSKPPCPWSKPASEPEPNPEPQPTDPGYGR